MNREIKFRAWDGFKMWYPDTKSEDGNDIRFSFYAGGIGWGVYDNVNGVRLVTGDPNAIFNTPGEIMQFTGLKDKNGKDIYEGDIVRSPHFIDVHKRQHYLFHEVKWDVKYHLWKTVAIGNKEGESINAHGNPPLWIYFKNEQNAEVIGNIYEHPHLLNNEPEDERSVATKMPKAMSLVKIKFKL